MEKQAIKRNCPSVWGKSCAMYYILIVVLCKTDFFQYNRNIKLHKIYCKLYGSLCLGTTKNTKKKVLHKLKNDVKAPVYLKSAKNWKPPIRHATIISALIFPPTLASPEGFLNLARPPINSVIAKR